MDRLGHFRKKYKVVVGDKDVFSESMNLRISVFALSSV
jgi:hypothetical protein